MSAAEVPSDHIVAAAVDVTMEARWIAAELASRRPADLVPDLLRGHAAELATSAAARDQILAAALEAAAQDLERAAAPLEDGALFFCHRPAGSAPWPQVNVPSDDAEEPALEAAEVARAIEARLRAETADAGELSRRLAAEARLQADLWDDPRIPAPDRVRRVMRDCAPLLGGRAEALDPSRGRAADDALRRPPIVLSKSDYETLRRLALDSLLESPRFAAPLLGEIERAAVLPEGLMPPRVVRLGSEVEYSETLSGRAERIRLTPGRKPAGAAELPVLSSTGSALIGLSEGQSILWQDHFGLERHLTVRRVWDPQPHSPGGP